MKKLEGKNEKDLKKMLAENRESLRKFRFDMNGSKLKNVKEGRNLRHDIARILTRLNVMTKSETAS